MLSNKLRRMTKGYSTEAGEQGYQQQAAVPIYSSKIQALLQLLMQQQQDSSGTDRLLLLRDGLMISLLWQSCFRGFNVGALKSMTCAPENIAGVSGFQKFESTAQQILTTAKSSCCLR